MRAPVNRKQPGWLGFVLPPILLGSVVLAVSFLLASPPLMFGALAGAILVGSLIWILASSLWASKSDRRCPACGDERLVRLDPTTTMGLACAGCDWQDDSASSWYLAEEEGPLEEAVMKSRGRSPLVIHPWSGESTSTAAKSAASHAAELQPEAPKLEPEL